MKLNLEAKTKAQQLVMEYLENNVSPALAEKINAGVKVVKDGKTLINKKTLNGFMKYATEEARKLAEKGANSACVEDDVVFGWAIHYFEEDEIIGTLYNADGTEYKKQSGVAAKATTAKTVPPKPAEKPQISMFDMLTNGDNSDISPTQSQDEDIKEDLKVDRETGEIIRMSEEKEPETQEQIPTVSDLLTDYDGDLRTDAALEDEISAIIEEKPNEEKPQDDFDMDAFDKEVLAELSLIFGDEITIV